MTPEHERGLLDTSVLVDLPSLRLQDIIGSAAISAVTLAELTAGPSATKDPVVRAKRQQYVQWVENTLDVLPVDASAARYYGYLCSLVYAQGRQPRGRIADLLIASTAAARQLPLLTRNPKDFVGLEPAVTVIAV
ncbi:MULTISPECIES: type II toxin-antitoxin system VapC family toxin [Actinokineospora]|uniref:PIN domain-containing protein n=1 Tax=Actinokineospora fastidiosa TaxID=1816 RepID=A0A918LG24_9PSEU|nr:MULTISPECIES: type II toxin-antitoxin system VapC family toxin [Actinokineospora]UVS77657.1 Ribonuclease VapC5 [Actinokineospora sp. UTMC 2448]GGS41912.1 hypothetical protein GCM10010171_40820 [Actinokineospora fastidiosa]